MNKLSTSPEKGSPSGGPKYYGCLSALALLSVACVAAVIWYWVEGESTSQVLEQGRAALEELDHQMAHKYADVLLLRNPESGEALLLAGQAAAGQGRFQEALDYYSRIGDDRSSTAVKARCYAGDMQLMQLANLPGAEEQFRRAAEQDPECSLANNRLAYIEGLGRGGWLATAGRIAIIRHGEFAPVHLQALGNTSDGVEERQILLRYYQTTPEDPSVLTALARQKRSRTPAEAVRLLRQAVTIAPDFVGAQVELGRILLRTADADFGDWHAKLSPRADEHPEIWALRGRFARKHQEAEIAARCFWETVRRDANHRLGNYQLGQLLVSLGREEDAAGFLERAKSLEAYARALEGTTGLAAPEMIKVAELAESLTLFWEAYGWCYLVLHDPGGDAARARQIIERVQPRLEELGDSRSIPNANPAARVDLSSYPLPNWSDRSDAVADRASSPPETRVTFEDSRSAAGLNFAYFNGGDPRSGGMNKMYEFTGGGVAVLDFDCDGWPDLYFTQGAPWPVNLDRYGSIDQLYRNLGTGEFRNVTEAAAVAENGFSQGATVGDFNNDGFPDLYVGNIGGNRLYQNNGDGTFADVTEEAAVAGERWTTSCLIADLNGDTWPDIYAVNYLTGDDLFTRICGTKKGRTLCRPQYFLGAQDELFLSLGDGRFKHVTDESGVVDAEGRGMGIVAADFFGKGKLDLFVANDMAPNFFFVNQTQHADRLRFAERGLLAGLASNRDGRFEACMGIAAGDSDGDGRIDLFVTNFDLETNTLYKQLPGEFFDDATQRAGLAEPSINVLGFGAQFIDGELDGDLDLIVTNGHVDDARSMGRPYQMPPQYFENLGDGRFALAEAEALGTYFQGKYLGRGLAKLDWNRDGREDVVISHLDAPVALLTNTTNGAGRFLAIKLVAVASARDAIGTTVTVTAGGRTLVRQLTAGDGYQASDQRSLTFGLGDSQRVQTLRIDWPSGKTQELTDLPSDAELLFIENRSAPVLNNGSW